MDLPQLHTKWSETSFVYNISTLSNERLLICVISFLLFFFNKSAGKLCGETSFILIYSHHSVSCNLCAGFCARQRHGTALLGELCASSSLRSFTAILDTFSSLGVEGRKQSMCAQQRQTFQTWLISLCPCCANPSCCQWNGARGSKRTKNGRKETKERSNEEDQEVAG